MDDDTKFKKYINMKYRWLICIISYEIEGTEIPKGRMEYTNCRFPVNGKWRNATQEEIDTKQCFKGNYFNLKNV